MPKDAIPAIPVVPPSVKDPQQRAFYQAVKDTLQTRAGQTKNRLDYSPTIRELRDAGVINIIGGSGLGAGGPPLTIGPNPPGTPFDDITKPLAPTGVIARATPWMHHITWDTTTESNHWIVSFGEVWFSETNDRETAVLAGTGNLAFSHPVDPLSHYFYWVRYISYAGVEGYWSNDRYDGVEAISPPDPETLRETLAGSIRESELYKDLNDRLDYFGVSVDATQNQWSVKINNDGNIAGIGLIVDGEENYDPNLGHSQFGVAADTFWVSAPGVDDFAFIVDAQNQRVVMDGAFIAEATITGLAVKDAAIDTAHIADLSITTAKIEDGVVTDLKIGDEIRSYALDLSNGHGWQILKNGQINAAEIVIYDQNGARILASGPNAAPYFGPDINNNAQKWAEVSDIPDHLELSVMNKFSAASFGDVYFEQNEPSLGWLTIKGTTIYVGTGRKDVFSTNEAKIDCHLRDGYNTDAMFIVYTKDAIDTKVSGFSTSGWTTKHFVPCIADANGSIYAKDAAGTERRFYPNVHDTLVATCSRGSWAGPEYGFGTFSNLIGVNKFLPTDGATINGNDNLIPDGDFEGLKNESGYMAYDSHWWDKYSGTVEYYYNSSDGPGVKMHSNAGAIYAHYEPQVVGGETLYVGMRYFMQSGANNWIAVVIEFLKGDGTGLGSDFAAVANHTVSPKSTFSYVTGVIQAPSNAVSCRVFAKNYSTSTWGIVNHISVCRAPTGIGVVEAGTYIKDASLGTLQLAGATVLDNDAVFVSAPSTVPWNVDNGTKVLIENSITAEYFTAQSSFLIHWSAAWVGDGGEGHQAPQNCEFIVEGRQDGGPWTAVYSEHKRPAMVTIFMGQAQNTISHIDHDSAVQLWYQFVPGVFTGTRTYSFRIVVKNGSSSSTWNGQIQDQMLLLQTAKR